jgi:predicted dehydrogenase
MSRPPLHRRTFLKTAAAVGVSTLAAPNYLRARNANEKLNIAMIACGGRGAANLRAVESENIVALCDVDQNAVDKAAEKHKNALKFQDFRQLFDKATNRFDAVVISTCEHTHALASLMALHHGKHVYCEKPLTHNIWEARVIREAAAKTKLATQMGNQNHASENFRRVIELIRTNAIGPVTEVHVWVSRAWGLQSVDDAKKYENHPAFKDEMVGLTDRPKEIMKVPPHLDWDLWLGPAPERPFHSVYVPGPKWYRWWDFGNGTMSDLGSHWNDLPFWALKLKAPISVEAKGPKPHPEIAPASMQAIYEFPARDSMPPVQLTWYQGTMKPEIWTAKKIPQWANGILFIGSKGMILADASKHVLLPEKDFEGFQRPEPFLEKSPGHYAEWIHACKTGTPTLSNFEYAGWLTESNHLGNVAFRAGKKLLWDADKMRATNCPEADAFIRREYRKGWKLV